MQQGTRLHREQGGPPVALEDPAGAGLWTEIDFDGINGIMMSESIYALTLNSISSPGDDSGEPAPALPHPGAYRIFISYSHKDRALAERIAAVLRDNGLEPMWDRNFAFGRGFHEQIRLYIAHAHVFLPVLTQEADARKWVHQEIGYAMALNTPVLPVAIGHWPGEMLQQIHAVSVEPERIEDLRPVLTESVITRLIGRHSQTAALYTCADLPDVRAQMMADYAEDVLALGYHGMVRQKGGLSSFNIPTRTIRHQVWKDRYGDLQRGEDHCRRQRRERLALGKHAEVAKCRLIVNTGLKYEEYGPEARLCRLRCLLAFLKTMRDDQCQVAIKESMPHAESITIVGDWFAAESRTAHVGKGYFQTTFTRHAPTVIERINEFDCEFAELLECRPEESRMAAIERIRDVEQNVAKEIESHARKQTAVVRQGAECCTLFEGRTPSADMERMICRDAFTATVVGTATARRRAKADGQLPPRRQV